MQGQERLLIPAAEGPSGPRPGALLATRSIRAAADGLVAAGFAALLATHGFDERAVGLLVTAALLGSAGMLAVAGRWATVLTPPRVLVVSAVLMVVTGAVFAVSSTLAVLMAVALVGAAQPDRR